MRYFLISYSFEDSFGNFFVESNKFPSQKELLESLNKKHKGTLIVQNIFEFKDKKDYENFIEV